MPNIQTKQISFETRFQIGDIILAHGIKGTVQGFNVNTEIGADSVRSNVSLICRILPNQELPEVVLRGIQNNTFYPLDRPGLIALIERPGQPTEV